MIVLILALATVRWWAKRVSPPSAGTFPVSGGTFLILLLGTILLVGALNFLPALALGPIVEQALPQLSRRLSLSRRDFYDAKISFAL